MKKHWATAGIEPSLAEILSDPILHQVMRRDRLSLDMIHSAIRRGQEALRRRAERTGAPSGEPGPDESGPEESDPTHGSGRLPAGCLPADRLAITLSMLGVSASSAR